MVKKHWFAIIIIALGTFLRTFDLENRSIFFGDSARDVLVAVRSVDTQTLPLLGIPSSRPQYKQGPASIWMLMILSSFFDKNIFVFSLAFSIFGIATMIALYEFCLVFLNKKIGEISLTLLAFSPLAVAHSRMLYHITPIPFFTVIALVACVFLWKKRRLSPFLATLSLAVLFQFELSLAPLFLLIPFILWRTKQRVTVKMLLQVFFGLFLGLLPQIVFDITHQFQQLGGFAKWLIYHALIFFVPNHESGGLAHLSEFFKNYWIYWGRIWSVDTVWIKIVMLCILIFSLWKIFRFYFQSKNRTRTSPILEVILMSFFFLTLGYLTVGTPSEAFFPPYIVYLPLILGAGIDTLPQSIRRGFLITFCLLGLLNAWNIIHHNFFVSNASAFNYGPSLGEQRKIVRFALERSKNHLRFQTQNPNGKFPTYLDNYRYILLEEGFEEKENGQTFYIEGNNSELIFSTKEFGKIGKRNFGSQTLFYLPNESPQ